MKKDIQQILFGLIDNEKGWSSLTASDWIVLLCNNHEYVAKCDKVNGWRLFTVRSWFELLKHCPGYESKFAEFDKQFAARDFGSDTQHSNPLEPLTWTTLNEYDWIFLIKDYPHQSDKYRYRIHDYDAVWAVLLDALKNPRLGFDWFGDGWQFLNSSDWVKLLKMDKAYAAKCTEFEGWQKLTVWDTIEVFKEQPSIIEVYPAFDTFDATEWVYMLDDIPQLSGKCDKVEGWRNFGKIPWNWTAGQDPDVEFENCWAYLLPKYPEWANRCDKFNGWDDFSAYDWLELLKKRPEFACKCDRVNGWKNLTCRHWVKLLQKQPEFVAQCNAYAQWLQFDGFDWVELLREQPIFADKCDAFDGWQKLDFTAMSCGCQYEYIIHGMISDEEHDSIRIARIDGVRYDCKPYSGPSEYLYYDENGKVVKREQDKPPFCGRWAELLEKQPQFAKKCDEYNGWEVFDGFDWYVLLSAQPCFAFKCNSLNGWTKMIQFRPKEYHCCEDCDDEWGTCINWSEHEHETFYAIPKEYENTFSREKRLLASNCHKGLPVYCWMIPEYCKAGLLKEDIDDVTKCLNDTLEDCENSPDGPGFSFSLLIESISGPSIDSRGNNEQYGRSVLSESKVWDIAAKLPKNFWVYFLSQCPRAAMAFAKQYDVANVWATFTIDDWNSAIANRTLFVNAVASFEGQDAFLDALLSAWPDFFDQLGFLPKEHGGCPDAEAWSVECYVWPFLITHRPNLAVHMKWRDWERFSEHDWKWLLHPLWHYIERATVPIDGRFWWLCLSMVPQFATLCEQHGGWSKLSNYYLCDLIDKNSNLLEYCVKYLKWDELTSSDWLALFAHENESKMFITKCDKHNGWEKFATRKNEWDCLGWVGILKERPDLASKCDALNGWPKFNGTDWQVLLSAQPQLAGRCDAHNGWKTLGEGHWMRLINRQAHFADKYNKAHTAMGIETQPEAEVVDQAKEFVKQEQSRI